MKIFQNKKIFNKLIIVFLIVMMFSFCIPKAVSAVDLGGVLLKPIVSLFLTLGDGLMNLIHQFIADQSDVLIAIDLSGGTLLWAILIGVGIAVLVVITAGAALAAGGLIATSLGFATTAATLLAAYAGQIIILGAGTGIAATYIAYENLEDQIDLPIYTVTPERIFAGDLAIFDVDFFNPNRELKIEKEATQYGDLVICDGFDPSDISNSNEYKDKLKKDVFNKESLEVFKDESVLTSLAKDSSWSESKAENIWGEEKREFESIYDSIKIYEQKINFGDKNYIVYKWVVEDTSNNIRMHNFYYIEGINAKDDTPHYASIAYNLRGSVSTWYVIIRNMAIVLSLSMLVYIAIRIIISSTAGEKSKYKQFLMDWFVALCLIFTMHYIMSFSNIICKKLIEVLKSAAGDDGWYYAVIPDPDEKIEKALRSNSDYGEIESILQNTGVLGPNDNLDKIISKKDGKNPLILNGKEVNSITWRTTLTGLIRINAQLSKSNSAMFVGYMILYCMVVIFTVMFVFVYLRRIVYMAFLTIMAPFFALMYPLDKMNDGKAQSFDKWLKEYIFNLLIQPLHFLLYTVLVTSSLQFVKTNPIFSVVCLGFMIPAEKLLKSFFGFEKSGTTGGLGNSIGAAVMWNGISKLMRGKSSKGNGNNRGRDDQNDEKAPRFNSSFDKENEMIDGFSGGNLPGGNPPGGNVLGGNVPGGNPLGGNPSGGNPSGGNPSGGNLPGGYPSRGNSRVGDQSEVEALRENALAARLLGQDNVNQENRIKRAVKRIINKPAIRGAGRAAGKYTRRLTRKSMNTLKNVKPIRTLAGVAGAAAFGTAGAIIGAATGDISNVAKFGAAGVVGGYNTGGAVYNRTGEIFDVGDGIIDEYEKGYYGSNEAYERAKMEEYAMKVANSEDVIDRLREQGYSRDKMKSIREEVIPEYIEAGITDVDEIMGGIKMEDMDNISRNKAISALKYSSRIGNTDNMTTDNEEKWINTLANEYSANQRVRENGIDSNYLGRETFKLVQLANKRKKR